MRVILTGFEPFGGDRTNPSARLAEDLAGRQFRGLKLETRVLPVTVAGIEAFAREFSAIPGRAVAVACGLAAGRTGLSAERVAVNCYDFRMPDNSGRSAMDEAIANDGPAAYFSGLPVRAIANRWRELDIPGHVSNSAGTYLCNGLFYLLSHHARDRADLRAGFIHVPATPDMVRGPSQPSLPYGALLRGVEAALETSLEVLEATQAAPDGPRESGAAQEPWR